MFKRKKDERVFPARDVLVERSGVKRKVVRVVHRSCAGRVLVHVDSAEAGPARLVANFVGSSRRPDLVQVTGAFSIPPAEEEPLTLDSDTFALTPDVIVVEGGKLIAPDVPVLAEPGSALAALLRRLEAKR